jgi:hypothetical protein
MAACVSTSRAWRCASSTSTLGSLLRRAERARRQSHGIAQGTGDLNRDTNSLLRSFAQSNPQLQQSGNAKNESVAGRSGVTVQLANVSGVTGQPEYISLSTTELRNGGLLYVIGVAPRTEAGTYDNAFKKVRQNIQVSDK